jgi:hypothetical protein
MERRYRTHSRHNVVHMSAKRGRRFRKKNGPLELVAGMVFVGFIAWQAAPQLTSTWTMLRSSPEEVQRRQASAYYANCTDARAAGAAPIYAGEPGYREEMDGDSDGIACEPYR